MDSEDNDLPPISIQNPSNFYNLMKPHSPWFEIRLFYVRISPCVASAVPDHLTLRFLRRDLGVALELNGAIVPASDSSVTTLRRDRVNEEMSEVTYLTTDTVRITGGVEFEVLESDDVVMLCGSIERLEVVGNVGVCDSKSGWSMECFMAGIGERLSSVFVQPKLGVSAPSFEVYIAGCCSGVPVILTKVVQVSPRRKVSRYSMLDAIPEGEEVEREDKSGNTLVKRMMQITNNEVDEDWSGGKFGHNLYSEDMYYCEDGQMSWFNAGVRVGVGIGLGVCLGVGIGVGLLMRSYQTTTRNFRRRFL